MSPHLAHCSTQLHPAAPGHASRGWGVGGGGGAGGDCFACMHRIGAAEFAS